MASQVELVLRNQREPENLLRIFIEPAAISLGARWVAALERTLARPHLLEKDFSFLGFLGTQRDKSFLCARMNRVLGEVSAYRGEGAWREGYGIAERCDPATLDFSLLNRLHRHFENLMGQVWNVSPYYLAATPAIRLRIREINFLVHELESFERSAVTKAGINRVYPHSEVTFLTDGDERTPLEDEDYERFSIAHEFGMVHLNYCQIGKSHYDAWRDKDEDISGENINGLRYCSGNFTVRWGMSSNPDYQRKNRIQPFFDWLKAKGIEPVRESYFVDSRGVKHGLGFLTVGRIPLSQFGSRSVPEVQDLVERHNDLVGIRLHHEGRVSEGHYPYRLGSAEYEGMIQRRL